MVSRRKGLQTEPGVPYAVQPHSADVYQDIFLEYDLLSLIEKDIKQYYNPMFTTLSDKRLNKINSFKKQYPLSFKNLFAENDFAATERTLSVAESSFSRCYAAGVCKRGLCVPQCLSCYEQEIERS
jgi:hypothetical protein